MKRIDHKLYLVFFCIFICISLFGCSAGEYVEEIDDGNSSNHTVNTENEESSENIENIPEEAARAAYFDFLSGDVSLLEDIQLGQSWVDFYLPNSELEYVFLDLDGDDVSELLIQWIDSPERFNAVFHYSAGTLFCWNFDSVEMSSRNFPLQNGTIVHQYDYSGTSSWTGFHYLSNGESEELFDLYARYEVTDDNDTSPVPCYEIDGVEVDQMTFESELEIRITNQMLERSVWTANNTTDDAVLRLKPCAAYQDILDNAYEVIITDSMTDIIPADELFRYGGIREAKIGRDTSEALAGIGYTFYDVDGNGIEELIIADMLNDDGGRWDNRILLMYTLYDDKPVLLIDGWARNRYYLLNDGTIYHEGSGGAAYTTFATYRMAENGISLDVIDYYFSDYRDDSSKEYSLIEGSWGWFHNTTGEQKKDESEWTEFENEDVPWEMMEGYLAQVKQLDMTFFETMRP